MGKKRNVCIKEIKRFCHKGLKKKICVVTGSRADYGLLRLFMLEWKKQKNIGLQIIAAGSHFSEKFGSTYRQILRDGFAIDAKVNMELKKDSLAGLGKAMCAGMDGYSRALAKLCPDLLVLLGDRHEILGAAIAATLAGIPIAHLHGGELTEGAYDDAFRHAITKMSHLHFTSAKLYRRRVIQMGEHPSHVFNVGALGADNVLGQAYMSRKKLSEILRFQFQKRNLLVTYHPTTLEDGKAEIQIKALLMALARFPDFGILFTMPGADKENSIIWTNIQTFVRQNHRSKAFLALGSRLYLSVMKEVDAVVGNSSSGLLEAPVLNKPVVNIGSRQQGRMRASTVIDCGNETSSIQMAIQRALSRRFQSSCRRTKNPHGKGGVAKKIVKILQNTLQHEILIKRFYDLPR